jgi:hypothetical protein
MGIKSACIAIMGSNHRVVELDVAVDSAVASAASHSHWWTAF